MQIATRRSLVAVDVTARGIAFVFFENGDLLDWGERIRTPDENETGLLDRVLAGCAADVLVLEDADADGCRRRPRVRMVLRVFAKHARRHGIPVVVVNRSDVRAEWSKRNIQSKRAVASELARQFPALEPIAVRRHRPGDGEDPRLRIFDALTLVLHAFHDSP